jgi:hypothetical protein
LAEDELDLRLSASDVESLFPHSGDGPGAARSVPGEQWLVEDPEEPEDADDGVEWPQSGSWSTVRAGVPVLEMPALSLRDWYGVVATAHVCGLISKGAVRLAKWLQALQDKGGPDAGAEGWFPFRRHSSTDDLARHYCSIHGYRDKTAFYRHRRELEQLGLVACVQRSTDSRIPVYALVLRADSPVIGRLPLTLARALQVGQLARLWAERDLPWHHVPGQASLADVVSGYTGVVALTEEDAQDAAKVSLAGQLEIAMLAARTPAEEAFILKQAAGLQHGWANPDGTPSPQDSSQEPRRASSAPLDTVLPSKARLGPLPASLNALALVKRTVFMRSLPECKTTRLNATGSSTSGLFLLPLVGLQFDKTDGKAKSKAAPTGRTTKRGAQLGSAADGAADLGRFGKGSRYGQLTANQRAEAEQVTRRVWAILRRARPRQDLVGGTWVPNEDGTAEWVAGTGYDDLRDLVGLCLLRVTEARVIEEVGGSVTDTAVNPLRVLCRRLWAIVKALDPVDQREDRSRPAEHVQAEAQLTARESGRRHQERVDQRKDVTGAVPVAESLVVEDYQAARDRRRTAAAGPAHQAPARRPSVFDEALDSAAAQLPRLAGRLTSSAPVWIERTAAERERTEQVARERVDQERGRGRLAERLAEIEARSAAAAAVAGQRRTLLERAQQIVAERAPGAEPIVNQVPVPEAAPAPAAAAPQPAGEGGSVERIAERARRILAEVDPAGPEVRSVVPQPAARAHSHRNLQQRLDEIVDRAQPGAAPVAAQLPPMPRAAEPLASLGGQDAAEVPLSERLGRILAGIDPAAAPIVNKVPAAGRAARAARPAAAGPTA